MSIVDAILATCASQPLFPPAVIDGQEFIGGSGGEPPLPTSPTARFKPPVPAFPGTGHTFLGGSLGFNNPSRELITEAFNIFGEKARVRSVLSLGAGSPNALSLPFLADGIGEDDGYGKWREFMEKTAIDNERAADDMKTRMGHLGLYSRFSVDQGLSSITSPHEDSTEEAVKRKDDTLGTIEAHTRIYTERRSDEIDSCIRQMEKGVGLATLEQLRAYFFYKSILLFDLLDVISVC